MSRTLSTAYLSTFALLIILGCDSVGSNTALTDVPESAPQAQLNFESSSVGSVTLLGYEIALTAHTVTDTETTFEYTVTPTSDARHDLSHSVFGFQLCDPALEVLSTDPDGGIVVAEDPTTGIGGVKFDISQKKNSGPKTYAITFAGSVAVGSVDVAVKASRNTATGLTDGAACGKPGSSTSSSILGTVFIDTDGDDTLPGYGLKEAVEEALANVTLLLLDPNGNPVLDDLGSPLSVLSDVNGFYEFDDVPAGTYYVQIPKATTAADVNETLYQTNSEGAYYLFTSGSLAADGSAQLHVQLQSDVTGVDFGFLPQGDAIAFAFNSGQLQKPSPLPFSDWHPLIAGLMPYQSAQAKIGSEATSHFTAVVNDFEVQFLGRSYDGANTTFWYRMEGTGTGKDLSHATFEVGECATLVSTSPQSTGGTDPTTGVTGAKFDFSVSTDGSQVYTLTFGGLVDSGVIDVALKNGRHVGFARMPGACLNAVGTVAELSAALDDVFAEGASDPDDGIAHLFLEVPFPLVNPNHESQVRVEEALRILSQPGDFSDSSYTLSELEQLLLATEVLYGLGLADSDATVQSTVTTILQFSETIVHLLRSMNKDAGIYADTGGSDDSGSMLKSLYR